MFKPISAGLMCLGLATLGVTMLRGDVGVETEDLKGDILYYTADASEGIAPEAGIKFTGPIAEGAAEGVSGSITVDVADIKTDIGEINVTALPERQLQDVTQNVISFVHPAGVVDPAARETLEKIVKQLREEETRLRAAGRFEESVQKGQTAVTLESVIRGHGPFFRPDRVHVRTAFNAAVPPPVLIARIRAEQEGFQARLAELQAKRAAIQAQRPESPEVAEIDKAISEIKQATDERRNEFRVTRGKMANPNFTGNFVLFDPSSDVKHVIVGSDADSLTQKADALLRAAEVLSSAGLEEKARELKEKGEKTRAEAAQLQAKYHFNVTHPAGPPAELHRTLIELREQVQQLRKEVAELRTLLEKKQ